MPPILGAKREEGQSRGRLNLERARALLTSTRLTAGLPQISKHRHKHTKRCARSTAAAAGPWPEGAIVMVRRDHTFDEDAYAQTQKGEKECRHVQTQYGRPGRLQDAPTGVCNPPTTWNPTLRAWGPRWQATPTAVGCHAYQIKLCPLILHWWPLASHSPLITTPMVVLRPLPALKIIVRPATMGRLAVTTAATGPGCMRRVTDR